MNREDAIKKAQKLMAVAGDGRGNDNEAERALAQAEALMRKFGIEQAEVVGAASQGFDWANDFAPYGVPRQPAKSVPLWADFVAVGVAIFTDTIVRKHYKADKGYGHGFYGERSDVMFAVWLQTYLRDIVWREVKKAAKEHGWGRVESEDFRKAMSTRLQARMKALRAERDKEFAAAVDSRGETGTALVIVSDKLVKRDAEFGEQKFGKTQQVSVRSASAIAAGREAGNRVGFNRVVGGGAEKARIAA
jgi:hypothetical protein